MPCEFEVRVLEKKGHIHWSVDREGKLLCHPSCDPLSADANREILTAIAEAIGISKSKVELIHGVQDYLKLIKVTDHNVTLDLVYQALGVTKR